MQEIEISQWLFELPAKDRTANPAHLAAIFCPVLVFPEIVIVKIKFLAYFCKIPLSSRHEKRCQMLETLFAVLK